MPRLCYEGFFSSSCGWRSLLQLGHLVALAALHTLIACVHAQAVFFKLFTSTYAAYNFRCKGIALPECCLCCPIFDESMHYLKAQLVAAGTA